MDEKILKYFNIKKITLLSEPTMKPWLIIIYNDDSEEYVKGEPDCKIYLNNLEAQYNNNIRIEKINKIDGCC